MQPDSDGQATVLGSHVQPTADVDERAELGAGTRVWHLAQIRENAQIGRDCIIGRGAYVGPGVVLGDHVKLQNYALVYEPARLGDAVFIGPSAVLTNDVYPRSVGVTGQLKRPADWDAEGVVVREGASVGARAVILAGVEIGRWGPHHRRRRGDTRRSRLRPGRWRAGAADRVGGPGRGEAGAGWRLTVALPADWRTIHRNGRDNCRCKHLAGSTRLTLVGRQARQDLKGPCARLMSAPRCRRPAGGREKLAGAQLDSAVTRLEYHDF